MFDFSAWLKKERKAKKTSQPQLAAWLNLNMRSAKPIDHFTVSNWERGIAQPNYLTFFYILLWAKVQNPYSLVLGKELYNLNEEGVQRLNRFTQEQAALMEASRLYLPVVEKPQPRQIRFYDVPVSAGTGNFLEDAEFEMIDVDDLVPDDADFAVLISGDSMMPLFVDKQTVYVREQSTLNNGEFGIFILNGEAFIKKLETDGSHPKLVSLNKNYDPKIVGKFDRLDVLGKVVR